MLSKLSSEKLKHTILPSDRFGAVSDRSVTLIAGPLADRCWENTHTPHVVSSRHHQSSKMTFNSRQSTLKHPTAIITILYTLYFSSVIWGQSCHQTKPKFNQDSGCFCTVTVKQMMQICISTDPRDFQLFTLWLHLSPLVYQHCMYYDWR